MEPRKEYFDPDAQPHQEDREKGRDAADQANADPVDQHVADVALLDAGGPGEPARKPPERPWE